MDIIHLCSNGKSINKNVINLLEKYNVEQVQINYQGSELHNKVYNFPYKKQKESIKMLIKSNIETTLTVTVNNYNKSKLEDIVREINELEINRFRFLEISNKNNPYHVEGLNKLFKKYKRVSSKYGYDYKLSYDPKFNSKNYINCPHLSGLYLYVNEKGNIMKYCAVKEDNEQLISLLENNIGSIKKNILNNIKNIKSKSNRRCYLRSLLN